MAFMPPAPGIAGSLRHGTRRSPTCAKRAVVRGKRPAICAREPLIASATEAAKGPGGGKTSALSDAQVEEWGRVRERVEGILSLDEVAADKIVARAFGWGSQKFWRFRKQKQPPSLSVVNQSLDFLTNSVGIDVTGLPKIIKNFPEVLALEVDRMQSNVDYIIKTYPNLKGQLLTRAVADNPAVLGYDFDCEGDCQSECARCWAQF